MHNIIANGKDKVSGGFNRKHLRPQDRYTLGDNLRVPPHAWPGGGPGGSGSGSSRGSKNGVKKFLKTLVIIAVVLAIIVVTLVLIRSI